MDQETLGQWLSAFGQIATPAQSGKIWPQFRAWVAKLGAHAAMHWPLSAASGARCQSCVQAGVVVCLVCRHPSCLDHAAIMSDAQAVCQRCISTIRPSPKKAARPPHPRAPPPAESTADFVNRVMRDFINSGRGPQSRSEYAPPHRPGAPSGFAGAASQRIDPQLMAALNVLNLPYGARFSDVKKRVKALVVELHPDHEPDPPRRAYKEEQLKHVLTAYETLKRAPAYAAEQGGASA